MLNISEYRDLISLFGEFSEKELSPKRLEIDKGGEALKVLSRNLKGLGFLMRKLIPFPYPSKLR